MEKYNYNVLYTTIINNVYHKLQLIAIIKNVLIYFRKLCA